MPLPEPEENESEDEFVSRCMSDEEIQEKFGEGTDQALAVCFNIYEEAEQESANNELVNTFFSSVRASTYDARLESIEDRALDLFIGLSDVGKARERKRQEDIVFRIKEKDERLIEEFIRLFGTSIFNKQIKLAKETGFMEFHELWVEALFRSDGLKMRYSLGFEDNTRSQRQAFLDDFVQERFPFDASKFGVNKVGTAWRSIQNEESALEWISNTYT